MWSLDFSLRDYKLAAASLLRSLLTSFGADGMIDRVGGFGALALDALGTRRSFGALYAPRRARLVTLLVRRSLLGIVTLTIIVLRHRWHGRA